MEASDPAPGEAARHADSRSSIDASTRRERAALRKQPNERTAKTKRTMINCSKRNRRIISSSFSGIVAVILSIGLIGPRGAVAAQRQQYAAVRNIRSADGTLLSDTSIGRSPTAPAGSVAAHAPLDVFPASAKVLNVPAFTFVYGSSAVAAAMIAGYYDRSGYLRIYAGPTGGGVMPMTDAGWPRWSDASRSYPNNPLVASKMGVDGRTTMGSINDYWVANGSEAQDPYIGAGRAQHAWGSAVGDYMKTSQSTYRNADGSTQFFNYMNPDGSFSAARLQCASMPSMDAGDGFNISQVDGTYGRKLFYQAKGYTVTDCFNQYTDNRAAGGFSFADFMTQIDAGRPVLINLAGRSVVGVGYDVTSSTVYIHDGWDRLTHAMTWGGSYPPGSAAAVRMLSVSIVNLAPWTVPTPLAPSGTVTSATPVFTWSRVPNATQYQFQVYQGATLKYTTAVGVASCGTNPDKCSNRPPTALAEGWYTWKVRAVVGGAWAAYSPLMGFVFSQGFNSQFSGSAAGWVQRPGAAWRLGTISYWTSGMADKVSSASYNTSYENFVYEARIKRAGTGYAEAGLIVRGNPVFETENDWQTAYYFIYSSYGDFAVYQIINNVWTPLKPWTISPSVVASGWNRLKVAANGSNLSFYINGTAVWSGSDTGIASGEAGVYTWGGGTATDRLDIDWATLTTSGAADALRAQSVEDGQMPSPYAHPEH